MSSSYTLVSAENSNGTYPTGGQLITRGGDFQIIATASGTWSGTVTLNVEGVPVSTFSATAENAENIVTLANGVSVTTTIAGASGSPGITVKLAPVPSNGA